MTLPLRQGLSQLEESGGETRTFLVGLIALVSLVELLAAT